MSANPFWTSKPKPPQKLTGTYEQLRAAAREQYAVLRGYSRE